MTTKERSSNIRYSDRLVALARTLDATTVTVMSTEHYFCNMEMDEPDVYLGPGEFPAWVHGNAKHLRTTLPGLRKVFLERLTAESEAFGMRLDSGPTGDVLAPASIKAAFGSLHDSALPLVGSRDPYDGMFQVHEPPRVLSATLHAQLGERKGVAFDDELFVIPPEVDDSVVEVWFRRVFGGWEDGGPYPCFLVTRPYGWQAYGVER